MSLFLNYNKMKTNSLKLDQQEEHYLAHQPSESNNNKNPFICNACHGMSISPVLPHCGHIYCWKCLKKQLQLKKLAICKVCNSNLAISEIRPIFISGEDHNCQFKSSRPKGAIKKPVINPTILTNFNQNNQGLANNIEAGRQVAGIAVLPSNFMLVFSRWDDQQAQNIEMSEQISVNNSVNFSQNSNPARIIKKIDECASKLQKCLIISILLVVAGIILLGGKI